MRRALYSPPALFSFWKPEPVEVEFVCWEPNGMARVRVPFGEKSVGALIAKQAGAPHPEPLERLVPAKDIQLFEAES